MEESQGEYVALALALLQPLALARLALAVEDEEKNALPVGEMEAKLAVAQLALEMPLELGVPVKVSVVMGVPEADNVPELLGAPLGVAMQVGVLVAVKESEDMGEGEEAHDGAAESPCARQQPLEQGTGASLPSGQ